MNSEPCASPLLLQQMLEVVWSISLQSDTRAPFKVDHLYLYVYPSTSSGDALLEEGEIQEETAK